MTEAPGEKVLGLVPARGGSKGIADKNLRSLGGKPLLQHVADCAEQSGVVDRLVLTTDDERIAELGKNCGIEVPFMRPPELAGDESPMLPVILQALEALAAEGYEPDYVLLLQPTSPGRTPELLQRCMNIMREEDPDSVVTLAPVPEHFSPHFVFTVDEENRLKPFLEGGLSVTRRQDVAKVYNRNGCAYLTKTSVLRAGSIYGEVCRPVVCEGAENFNLDTEEDWERVERELGEG